MGSVLWVTTCLLPVRQSSPVLRVGLSVRVQHQPSFRSSAPPFPCSELSLGHGRQTLHPQLSYTALPGEIAASHVWRCYRQAALGVTRLRPWLYLIRAYCYLHACLLTVSLCSSARMGDLPWYLEQAAIDSGLLNVK